MANGSQNNSIKMTRSVLQLQPKQEETGENRNDPSWYHLSVAQGSWILRRITPNGWEVTLDGTVVDLGVPITNQYNILNQLPMGQVRRLIGHGVPALQDVEAWMAIFDQLENIDAGDQGVAPEEEEQEVTIIPMTPLRRLYDFLRLSSSHGSHAAMAAGFAGAPGEFTYICQRSRELFEPYANAEGFLNEARQPLAHEAGMQVNNDRALSAVLQHNFPRPRVVPVVDREDLSFKYIEREVSPFRTTGGLFQNGLPASSSGKGGIDLLLESTEGVPIVGEVKIRNDASAFLALVQACCYAIELATPNQRLRLCQWLQGCGYGDSLVPGDCRVDVYIILFEYPDDEAHTRCLADTMRVAHGALANGLDNAIRHIEFLDAHVHPKNGLSFSSRALAP